MRVRVCIIVVCFILLANAVLAAEIDSDVLHELAQKEEAHVIITLQNKDVEKVQTIAEQKELIKKNQQEVLEKLELEGENKTGFVGLLSEEKPDLQINKQYTTINAIAGKITPDGLQKLLKEEKVATISLDKEISILLDASVPQIRADDVNILQFDDQYINGTGQVICVVDTGVDYTHPALGGCTNKTFADGSCQKVIGGVDIADGDGDPRDLHGHGTHVAGIAAAEDTTYRGVAPGARVVAVKVFPQNNATTTESNVLAGIDWCKDNASLFNISIITLSLGDGIKHTSACDSDSLAQAANSAVQAGIFVDAASGNNGFSDGISSPACASNVTSVGAVNNGDAIPSFSNGGSLLDLLAPGTGIRSTSLSNSFTGLSGTSMAAPHVAGVAALFYQYWQVAYDSKPSVFQVRDKLKATGKGITDSRTGMLFPRIDIFAALQPLLNFSGETPAQNATASTTFIVINVTSDIPLSSALLEWNYRNGTIQNISMHENNNNNFFYNMTGLVRENYSYKIYANDSADLMQGESEERFVFIDRTPPTISIIEPINGSYHNSAFASNISIVGSGLSFISYNLTNASGGLFQERSNTSLATNSVNNSVNLSDLLEINNGTFHDGNYSLEVLAKNTFGDIITKSVIFAVDKTNPSLVVADQAPAAVFNNDTVLLRINVTDENVNTSQVYIETNFSGTLINYSMNFESGDTFNFTISGTNNLSNQANISYMFYVIDEAGNENVSENMSFFVQNRAPTNVTISSPVAGTVLELGRNSDFAGSGVDADNDPLQYTWNFGDGALSASGQSAKHVFTSVGSYIVTLNVSDGLASVVTNKSLIVNDTQAPLTTKLEYATEHHLQRDGNIQAIAGTFFDHSGVSAVTLLRNQTEQTATCVDGVNSRNCSWNLTGLAVGSHTFTIKATDNFTVQHTNATNYDFSVASCFDGARNGNEAGVDCGGSCSATCAAGGSGSSGGSSGSSGGSSGGGGGSGGSSGGSIASAVSTAQDISDIELPTENEVEETLSQDTATEDTSIEVEPSVRRDALTGAATFGLGQLWQKAGGVWLVAGVVLFVVLLTTVIIHRRKRRHYYF